MRVLMLTPTSTSTSGGVSTYVRNLQRGLLSEGYRVEGISYLSGPTSRFPLVPFVRRVFKARQGADSLIIHAHGTWQTAVPFAFHRDGTTVFTFHTEPTLDRHRTKTVLRSMLRWTSKPTAVSSYLKDRIEAVAPNSSITVVPPVVTPLAKPPDRVGARKTLKIPSDSHVIAFVGPLVYPEKVAGLKILFQALALAPRHFRVVVAGGGHLLGSVVADAKSAGVEDRATILGDIADVTTVLVAADMYVQASLKDNMPLAVLEAMAAGVPVIGFPVGAIAEVIEDGRTGIISRPDPHSLLEEITYLMNNPERSRELASAATESLKKRFSWAAVYSILKRVYNV